MIKFDRHNLSEYRGIMSFVGMIIFVHYLLFLGIYKVKSKKQLNYIHYLVVFIVFIETFFIIYHFNNNILHTLIYTLLTEIFFFLGYFEAIPRWVDDDIAEIDISNSSNDIFEPAAKKEVTNIQAADEMAQQSSKNTGGKNTEITVNVANGLDLKNNTIVLPSKPKQTKTDDEE